MRALASFLFLYIYLVSTACSTQSRGGQDSQPSLPYAVFRESSAEAGLAFEHFNGAAGDFYLTEIVGAGVVLLDYDGDGDLDVFLVQGSFLDRTKTLANALYPPPAGWKRGNRLFRNDLIPTGKLHFTDVTENSGLGADGPGMGVAVGDYDNDGRPDIFVTSFGMNILYRNLGNGKFADVTVQAGVADKAWSTSAAFCDYDGDGFLDLFVAHYVEFPLEANPVCRNPMGDRDYCGPPTFKAISSRLFHNLRNGRFEDVTRKADISSAIGAGLGVTCGDFNRDGKLGFYVANDQHPNNLWLNKGDV